MKTNEHSASVKTEDPVEPKVKDDFKIQEHQQVLTEAKKYESVLLDSQAKHLAEKRKAEEKLADIDSMLASVRAIMQEKLA